MFANRTLSPFPSAVCPIAPTRPRLCKASLLSMCMVASLLPAHTAAQILLVDTGAGVTEPAGAISLFGSGATNCSPQPACQANLQFLAGQFTLPAAATLTSVDGWMNVGSAGSVDVTVYLDNGGTPGTSLFTKRYVVGPPFYYPDWVPFTSYDADLPAGTFWLAFEPVDGTNFNGSMPGGAPTPLAEYAVSYGLGWFGSSAAFGMRIFGTSTGVLVYGTAARATLLGSIWGLPFDLDYTRGGIGQVSTLQGAGELPAGLSIARASLIEDQNGLSTGVFASNGICYLPSIYGCTAASGTARGVAFRMFTNTSALGATFSVNAVLEGAISTSGALPSATGEVHVFDTTMFSDTMNASGLAPAVFLVRPDLPDYFPIEALLASASETLDGPTDQWLTAPLTTDPITVEPGESISIVFAASVFAPQGGHAGFFNTLEPAPVFLADLNGDPVTQMEATSPSAPTVEQPENLVLTPLLSTNQIGTMHTVTATATDGNSAPVPGAIVYFTITSGPNMPASGPFVTDANGQATFTYGGAGGPGTDTIQAQIGPLQSNPVEQNWTAPGPLDHISISPADATIAAGESQLYSAQGFDVFNEDLGDLTAGTSFDIAPDGSCSGASCTAGTPGPHTVTGSHDGKTAHTTLTVTAQVAPPPVADGKQAGIAATFSRNATIPGMIDVTYDASTCAAENAIILYGDLGDFSTYQGCAQSSAGNSGSTTIDASGLNDVWFNIVWTNGSTGGHAGYAFDGSVDARAWTAAGFCGVTLDDPSTSTCP